MLHDPYFIIYYHAVYSYLLGAGSDVRPAAGRGMVRLLGVGRLLREGEAPRRPAEGGFSPPYPGDWARITGWCRRPMLRPSGARFNSSLPFDCGRGLSRWNEALTEGSVGGWQSAGFSGTEILQWEKVTVSCRTFIHYRARCSSVVRACAHGAMGCRIDPS